jgi:hypothetical protein
MIEVAFVVGDYPSTEPRRREDAARSYASAMWKVGIVPVASRQCRHEGLSDNAVPSRRRGASIPLLQLNNAQMISHMRHGSPSATHGALI